MESSMEDVELFRHEVSEFLAASHKQVLKIAEKHSDSLKRYSALLMVLIFRRERQIEELEQDLKRRKLDLDEKEKDLQQQQSDIDDTMRQLRTTSEKAKHKIKLNVGGVVFTTTIDTMASEKDTFFSAMFSGRFLMEPDDEGEYFIDRDPTHFDIILNHLRGVDVASKIKEMTTSQREFLQQEVNFYGITTLHVLFPEGISIVEHFNDCTKKIRWGITGWEQVGSKCYSDEFIVGGHALRLLFMCNKDPKYIAVYVTRGERELDEFYVRFRVTLVNQQDVNSPHSTELAEVVLNKKHYDWGWRKFLRTEDLKKNGFSVQGNLILEVVVTTETERSEAINEFFRYK
jgi:hypothetical protein